MNAPIPTAQISAVVQEVDDAARTIRDCDVEKEIARKKALAAARKLVSTLETPAETAFLHAFGGPDRVAVRIAISLRLFHTLAQKDGRPTSAAELASSSNAEHLLIVRIMRVLAASNFVGEAGVESYVATPLTKTMTFPPIEAALRHVFDHAFQVFPKVPAYIEKIGWKCPTDPKDAPFQSAMGTDLGFFEYLEQDTKAYKDFDTFMMASRQNRPIFADWFPVQAQIVDRFQEGKEGKSDNDVLIVDVGGGRGQDLEMFRKRFPQAPGRMVLQDLPRTVADAKLSKGVEGMAYDFLTPQPVKGACVYFFHYILHNWPDHLAAKILRNTASAMKPGYSRIILNEYILPGKGCPLSPSWADFHMMIGLAACERTEKQFHELAGSAGLEVVKFWYPEGSIDGVIELELASGKKDGVNSHANGYANGHANGQPNGH